MQKEWVVEKCISILEDLPPVKKVKKYRARAISGDGFIEIVTEPVSWQLVYEIKTTFSSIYFPKLIMLKDSIQNSYPEPGIEPGAFIVFANYINPSAARTLKENGINFVDTVGNIFLQHDDQIFVYVKGQKPDFQARLPSGRLMQKTGLQLIYILLTDMEAVNLPYRELSELSGIALGSVGWIMRELREKGYLEKVGRKKNILVEKKELFDDFVKGYRDKLRPKLTRGTYKTNDPAETILTRLCNIIETTGRKWALTGGFGAECLVHHYRGAELVFFYEGMIDNHLSELHMLPSRQGNITVLEYFSGSLSFRQVTNDRVQVAHPLLIYADLVNGGSDREIETAQMVYKQYLEDEIEKTGR